MENNGPVVAWSIGRITTVKKFDCELQKEIYKIINIFLIFFYNKIYRRRSSSIEGSIREKTDGRSDLVEVIHSTQESK
jgi:hypothetical protein